MQHDPLNDVMVGLKNAERVGKRHCRIRPASNLIGRVLKVMQENKYIGSFQHAENNRGGFFEVELIGNINNCGAIKPRYSVKRKFMEKYEARFLPAQGFGVLILTTPRGVLSHKTAKERNTGGKLLAYVY